MTNLGLQRTFILQVGRHELWRTLAYTELLSCKLAGTSYDVPWLTENIYSASWPVRVLTNSGLHRTFILQVGRHELWRTLAYREHLFCKLAGATFDELWLTQNFYPASWPTRVMTNLGLQRTFILQVGRRDFWRTLAYTEILSCKLAGTSYDESWLTKNIYFASWPARVLTNSGLHRTFNLQVGRHELWRTLAYRELLFCKMAGMSYDEP
jgi:hypothetical protein